MVATEEQIRRAVGLVQDPHINVPLTEMGMVAGIDLSPEGNVEVSLALPCLGCPALAMLKEGVMAKVRALPGVGDVRVRIDWGARWERSMLSERAREAAARSGYRI